MCVAQPELLLGVNSNVRLTRRITCLLMEFTTKFDCIIYGQVKQVTIFTGGRKLVSWISNVKF